jgi:hypothetical protein
MYSLTCAPEAIPLRPLLQPRSGLTGRLGDKMAPVPLLEDPLAAVWLRIPTWRS